jgi:hypothetical protein
MNQPLPNVRNLFIKISEKKNRHYNKELAFQNQREKTELIANKELSKQEERKTCKMNLLQSGRVTTKIKPF